MTLGLAAGSPADGATGVANDAVLTFSLSGCLGTIVHAGSSQGSIEIMFWLDAGSPLQIANGPLTFYFSGGLVWERNWSYSPAGTMTVNVVDTSGNRTAYDVTIDPGVDGWGPVGGPWTVHIQCDQIPDGNPPGATQQTFLSFSTVEVTEEGGGGGGEEGGGGGATPYTLTLQDPADNETDVPNDHTLAFRISGFESGQNGNFTLAVQAFNPDTDELELSLSVGGATITDGVPDWSFGSNFSLSSATNGSGYTDFVLVPTDPFGGVPTDWIAGYAKIVVRAPYNLGAGDVADLATTFYTPSEDDGVLTASMTSPEADAVVDTPATVTLDVVESNLSAILTSMHVYLDDWPSGDPSIGAVFIAPSTFADGWSGTLTVISDRHWSLSLVHDFTPGAHVVLVARIFAEFDGGPLGNGHFGPWEFDIAAEDTGGGGDEEPIFDSGGAVIVAGDPLPVLDYSRDYGLDMYPFLHLEIRKKDLQGSPRPGSMLLKRYIEGPNKLWWNTVTTIKRLPVLWDVENVDANKLKYLKHIVGWTDEKLLKDITDSISVSSLRKLIATSGELWNKRGPEDTIVSVLNLLTVARLRIWNWFDFRWVLDETETGEEHRGRDPWVIDLPADGTDEMRSNLRIVDSGGLDRVLVKRILQLMRPAGERFDITYLLFLDLFSVDYDNLQWSIISAGVAPAVINGALTLSNDAVTEYTRVIVSGSLAWTSYSATARLKGASGASGALFGLLFYWTSTSNHYALLIDTFTQHLYLKKRVAGTLTTIATVDLNAIGFTIIPDTYYALRVNVVVEGASNRIVCHVDGALLINVLDSSLHAGCVAFEHDADATIACDEVELFQLPADTDTLEINEVI